MEATGIDHRTGSTDVSAGGDLLRVGIALHEALGVVPLPLPRTGSEAARTERARLLEQFDDYLVPRLADPDRPLLVVVGGPTGVGKSTLVNTLVGQPVTQPGTKRPTTRSPVLIHHPDDERWFGRDGILPGFGRVDAATDDPGSIQLVSTPQVPAGVALIDSPDFDSVDDANRRLATRLLAAADMWLFVTSASRYSDEVPWQQLEVARQRGTPLMVVMNRIPPEDVSIVSGDLVQQLRSRGVGSGKVILVERGDVVGGLLRSSQLDPVATALQRLSTAPQLRRQVSQQCVVGALRMAARAAARIGDEARVQVDALGELSTITDEVYGGATESAVTAATDGGLMSGDLQSRWHALIGNPDAMPLLEAMRLAGERLSAIPPGDLEAELSPLEVALDLALETLVVDTAEQAAASACRALRGTSHGEAMIGWSEEDLPRRGRRLGVLARGATAQWRRDLTDLLPDGSDPVTTRGTAVALAVCALSTTDDDPAAASSGLVGTARARLRDVVADLMAQERARFVPSGAGAEVEPGSPERLLAAGREVERVVAEASADAGRSSR